MLKPLGQLKDTYRTLAPERQLKHLSTWRVIEAEALGHLKYLGTWTLGNLRHIMHSTLADSDGHDPWMYLLILLD